MTDLVGAHEAAGRFVDVGGVKTFVRDEGDGEAVVCVHGVPVSSFLYRKVLPELAQRGLRGIAFDLPGLGLADRPADFDYSWTGLGTFAAQMTEVLELDRFHLVIHDIGGPVGLELASRRPASVRSITILNTLIEADRFERPWTMEPFAAPGIGRVALAITLRPAFRRLMRLQGVYDQAAVTDAELDAHYALLKSKDGGRAFLSIMRSFERTPAKTELYTSVVRAHPTRIVWGEFDPAIRIDKEGEIARRITGAETIHRLAAKHFLQEDQAPAVAEHVAALVASVDAGNG